MHSVNDKDFSSKVTMSLVCVRDFRPGANPSTHPYNYAGTEPEVYNNIYRELLEQR
jgi:hypothetical protein